MITKPEYVAGSQQVLKVAQEQEAALEAALKGTSTINDSIKQARLQAEIYHRIVESTIHSTLLDVGETAVQHYSKVLDLPLTEAEQSEIVSKLVGDQYEKTYYNATLEQRLSNSRYMNNLRIKRSAYVGKTLSTRQTNLARIFRHPYPFGAQVHLDNRILLGQSVKLEHDIATFLCELAEVEFIKWTLSSTHPKPDICDDYASYLDKRVSRALKDRDIWVDPKGIYFRDEVPTIPHPNCQCSLIPLNKGQLTPTTAERLKEKLRDLLEKLF